MKLEGVWWGNSSLSIHGVQGYHKSPCCQQFFRQLSKENFFRIGQLFYDMNDDMDYIEYG